MSIWLMYAGLAGFTAGIVTMLPPRRKARHAGPSGARLQITHALSLVSNAKGVYASNVGQSNPTPQENAPHHTTSG